MRRNFATKRTKKSRRPLSSAAQVKKNQSDIRKIKSGFEDKFHDTTIAGLAIDNVGQISVLNNPAQGDTDSTRDGDSIMNKWIDIRGYIVVNTGATDQVNVVRFLLLWDKQVTIGNAGDVLESVGNVNAPMSPYKHDRRHQYMVLEDFTVSLSQNGSSAIKKIRIIHKLNKKTQFNAASTTINTGCLNLVMISDEATASLPPTFVFTSRVHFLDN